MLYPVAYTLEEASLQVIVAPHNRGTRLSKLCYIPYT